MLTNCNKTSFSQRLNLVLDKHNYPPKNCGRMSLLAEKFEITHKAAANWLNGVSLPSRKKIKLLSEMFDVTEDWLLFGEKDTTSSGLRKIPVLNFLDVPTYLNDSLSQSRIESFIEVHDSNGCRSFAIDMKHGQINFDFLLTKEAKLVFDPDRAPSDKLFALLQLKSEVFLTRLIEFEKSQFAFNAELQLNTPNIQAIKDNNTILSVLSEIKF
ncbi:helix-turn-helix transcriptional regulator [Shewanella sp. 202IG2-18]|uniref:helix-turn-helix domain-containing protein n=1 Tax=Parashewanella hymeniacidonis TaxID=2807618 RepID=UPI001960575E|nr:helix-turn-helix transcriptional regulator [Parashewanella hymeniacidonis]MBM7073000.1 helix-turn-helix transcriptional regulator [Parashewanella hymeniacidonis]